jgi:hypothetical protein
VSPIAKSAGAENLTGDSHGKINLFKVIERARAQSDHRASLGDPPVNRRRSHTEAAVDFLSKSINDLHAFNDGGSFDESDLTHKVNRLRKIVVALVPTPQRAARYLKEIDDALVVTAEERKAEQLVAPQFPGPFLLNRGKRLAHIAEGLRDDLSLGRLPGGSAREIENDRHASNQTSRHTHIRVSADQENVIAEPTSASDQGEAPPLVKWAIWCWRNIRRRPGWVILTLCVIATPLVRPAIRWYEAEHGSAMPAPEGKGGASKMSPDQERAAASDPNSCLAFLGESRKLTVNTTVIDPVPQPDSGLVPGDKEAYTLEITIERTGPNTARFTGFLADLRTRVNSETIVGAIDGATFSYEHTSDVGRVGGSVKERAEGHCSKAGMQGILKTTLRDQLSYQHVWDLSITK